MVDEAEEAKVLAELDAKLEKLFHPAWFSRVQWRYTKLRRRVKKLWTWLPIIWDDHDWDDHYVYVILAKKLKDMEVFFKKPDLPSVGIELHQKRMMIGRVLAERQGEGFYSDGFHAELKSRYPTYFDDIWEDRKIFTLKHQDKATEAFYRRIAKKWREKEVSERAYLFTLLTKYLPYWRD